MNDKALEWFRHVLCVIGLHNYCGYFYWHWMVCRECERCGAIKVILV